MSELNFEVLDPEDLYPEHFELWNKTKIHYKSYSSADYIMKRLLKSDFLVLKNFTVRSLCLRKRGQAIICAQVFFHKTDPQIKPSIGLVACLADLTNSEASFFWQSLRKEFPEESFIGPMNAHAYLGLSIPMDQLKNNMDFKKIGFATAGTYQGLQVLWQSSELNLYRKYFSFETQITSELILKLKSEMITLPLGFSVRPFRRIGFQKEMKIVNKISKQAFADHFNLSWLTDEENWDIFKLSWMVQTKGFCSFLLKDQLPIGFCMAMLDFNQVVNQESSDAHNLFSIVSKRHLIARARMVHIGILPEYRGKKLSKYLRHHVILNMVKNGIRTIESSYVDEANVNSIKNIESTEGKLLHEFSLFRTLKKKEA